MRNFYLAPIALIASTTAAIVFGSLELSISANTVTAASAVKAVAQAASASAGSTQNWTGVWNITSEPGGVLNIASDAGPSGSSLSGIIVFYVMNRETGQRIAIEPRTMVNPHLQGNALVFQVRRILKPHLEGDPTASGQPLDPTDIVDMKLTPESEARATLTCPKCGEAAPTELEKER